MPFASFTSTNPDAAAALAEIEKKFAAWADFVDLAVVFYTRHHLKSADVLASRLHAITSARALIGCPGETVVGDGRELEDEAAVTLWLAKWPGNVTLTPYHLTFEQTADGASLLGWPDDLDDADATKSLLLTLGDPFTFPTDDFLQQINDEKPGLAVAGGMASASQQPGANRLLLGDQAVDQGAVGVLVQGDFAFRTVVSQGCRPIGKPFVVTKAQHNILLELGGKPALAQLKDIWQQLSPEDQALVQDGLHIGRVINECQETFARGDFLIRNVMGIDESTGGIAITDRARAGQTVQFHVRDADSADEDLKQLVQGKSPGQGGVLLFSCNGRGTRLFPAPHHDVGVVAASWGQLPIAGFFAMGELGPVGGRNFIHGFTASLVAFEEPQKT